jgi:hypothetical protein
VPASTKFYSLDMSHSVPGCFRFSLTADGRTCEHDPGEVSTADMGTNFLIFSLVYDFWLSITLIRSSSNYDHNTNTNPRIKSIRSNVVLRATVVQLEGISTSKPVR